jgi:hypothetical protein
MSSENVQVVRRLITANRSDDLELAIDTAVALCDPGVEFTSVMAAVEPETYQGHQGNLIRGQVYSSREEALKAVGPPN